MVFNESLNRIQLISDEIVEIEALNEITREIIYVYTLKSEVNRRSTSAKMEEPWEVKVGYYGYSGGCYYFGTLYVDDNGTDLFVLATGTNAIVNPPICDGGEWA